MRWTAAWIVPSGLLFVMSCGPAHPPLAPELAALEELRGVIETEMTNHHTAMNPVTNLEYATAEDQHNAGVKSGLTTMSAKVSEIGTHCMTSSHEVIDVKAFASLINQLRLETGRHKTAMTEATTVEAATEEEMLHKTNSTNTLGKMAAEAARLRTNETIYVCMPGTHKH